MNHVFILTSVALKSPKNRWIYMIYPYSFNRSLQVLNRNLETTPFFWFAGVNLCSNINFWTKKWTTHLPVKVTTKMTIFYSSEAPKKASSSWDGEKSRSVLFCIFGWGPSVHLSDRLVHSHHLSFDRFPMHSRCPRWSLDTVLVDLIVQSSLIKVCLKKVGRLGTLSWPLLFFL